MQLFGSISEVPGTESWQWLRAPTANRRFATLELLALTEIAVGTIIADRPPHGPGRALISASGSYLGYVAAKRTACPHTRPPVGHAQSRSVSGTCQVEE